jgi:hypothetical protein
MYTIDHLDAALELQDVPPSSANAPSPRLSASEQHLHLAYFGAASRATPRTGDRATSGDGGTTLVRFLRPLALLFGPPGDETLHGHPLAERGLKPYSAFRIRDSSWVRALERRNAVHPRHAPERFSKYEHYVFVFQDSTFECVAEGFSVGSGDDDVATTLRAAEPMP